MKKVIDLRAARKAAEQRKFRENGQALLDMLLEHFDPSPHAATKWEN